MRLGCSLVCFFDPVSFLSYTIRVLPSALSLRNSVTNASGDERQVAWLQGCRPGAMDMVRLVDLRPGIYRPSAPACVRSEIDIVKQHEKLSLSWQLETSKPHMVGCPCGSAWGAVRPPRKTFPARSFGVAPHIHVYRPRDRHVHVHVHQTPPVDHLYTPFWI